MQPLHFKILINCGPCQGWIGKCLASVQNQDHAFWRAIVNIDPYDDGTLEAAQAIAADDSRITVLANPTRYYAMRNLVQAVNHKPNHGEDVCVVLDGDDWFLREDALSLIAEVYAQQHCWMTYGSWWSNCPKHIGGWPAYPPETLDFRNSRWLATAVRTWKHWLFQWIDPRDFLDGDGLWLRVTEDQAVMLPMLEMSTTRRAVHIAEALMCYNRLNPNCCGEIHLEEMRRNQALIRTRPAYLPLDPVTRRPREEFEGPRPSSDPS